MDRGRDEPPRCRQALVEIDYDTYAHGEALGWLNGTLQLHGVRMIGMISKR